MEKEFERNIFVSNILRGTRFEEISLSEMREYISDLSEQLDPKFNNFGRDIRLSELIYRNLDDIELRLLISAYAILYPNF